MRSPNPVAHAESLNVCTPPHSGLLSGQLALGKSDRFLFIKSQKIPRRLQYIDSNSTAPATGGKESRDLLDSGSIYFLFDKRCASYTKSSIAATTKYHVPPLIGVADIYIYVLLEVARLGMGEVVFWDRG